MSGEYFPRFFVNLIVTAVQEDYSGKQERYSSAHLPAGLSVGYVAR